jgi:hypothetical protein
MINISQAVNIWNTDRTLTFKLERTLGEKIWSLWPLIFILGGGIVVTYTSGVPRNFFGGWGSTNSVVDRG